MDGPNTMVDKIWQAHEVAGEPGAPSVLYVDLHLIHEVTSPQAFDELRRRGRRVRRPDRTVATVDHAIPTTDRTSEVQDPLNAAQIGRLEENCRDMGISLHGPSSPNQGIVHVIGPELGLTQPAMTIVCGDSHTSTHGALGALAFGIGTSEVAHVLATQCLLQARPKTFEVRVNGTLGPAVTAKDLALAVIARLGVHGAAGHVIEYTGPAVCSLSMEGRMTLCNMSIEAGARAGLVGPDETTIEYLRGRPFAPVDFEASAARWLSVRSDPGALFDRATSLDASHLAPRISYGTTPAMNVAVDEPIPDPDGIANVGERDALKRALAYMRFTPGEALLGKPIDVVFLGSCTNARISDLRAAAALLRGRRVARGVRVLVVPGSRRVRTQAEAEGLGGVFRAAGAQWREPGCSMCIAMNGDALEPGELAVSTSNRNFEGRQGPGGRTLLASPLTAAASAVAGCVADPRPLCREAPP
jgi:3-isopropylmalate/(R)-2-methylmalate dehydratase large subunit